MRQRNFVFFKDVAREMVGAHCYAIYTRNARSKKWTIKKLDADVVLMFPAYGVDWHPEKSDAINARYAKWIMDEALK